MKTNVHSLMEDSDDFDATVVRVAIEDEVGADRQFEIAPSDVIDRAARPSAVRERFTSGDEFTRVVFRLIVAPMFRGVLPDAFKIRASRRGEKKDVI